MKKLNLNIATAKKILFRLSSFLFVCPCTSFLCLCKERNKESTADFDAVLSLAEYFSAEIGVANLNSPELFRWYIIQGGIIYSG